MHRATLRRHGNERCAPHCRRLPRSFEYVYNAEQKTSPAGPHAGRHRQSSGLGEFMKRDMERELNRGFEAYGKAVVIPDASPAFTTDIWAAIEARRTARVFGFWAKALTSSALAASLMLGVLSSMPERAPEPEYLAAYLESPTPPQYDQELGYSIVDSETNR